MGQTCPFPFEHSDRAEIEIRQVFEMSDFDTEMTPELRKVEEQIRTQLEQRDSSSGMKH